MDIVPVIDIKDGKVIQGVHGKKSGYTGLKSKAVPTSNPLELLIYYESLGFSEAYIADIDGILNSKPNYELLKDISFRTGMSLMADIGVWTLEDVLNLEKIKPVISTETFSSLNILAFPREFILSLDVRDKTLLTEMNLSLKDFLRIIKDSKRIDEVLLIDLTRVGLMNGPNLEACEYVQKALPDKKIMYGGGVRNMSDVEKLFSIGIKKVFVGSALMSGSLLEEIYFGIIKE